MNKNFKRSMITPRLLKACEEQVQKYFGERGMGSGCDICFATEGPSPCNCSNCPLSNGFRYSCIKDPSYIKQDDRIASSKEQRLARGKRLIEILGEHGIAIIDVEVTE